MANSEAIKAENNLKTTRMEFSGRLRLRTLVALRWLAIIGQSIAIIVVGFLFHFPLPFLFP